MKTKIIHTSDWQIGKVFRFVDNGTMGLLQEARLRAITRLGELAGEKGAQHILVAGDVYDMEALSPRSLNQPLERMRNFGGTHWHLMPGNHDHYRPNGLWDQLRRKGLPGNVHIHTAPEPAIFEDDSFALLPAPLHHRRMLDDPTAYMDEADLPDSLVRVGLPPAQAPPNSPAFSAHAGNDSSDELTETPWATVTRQRLMGIRHDLRVIIQRY